jgi:hypothetical protein
VHDGPEEFHGGSDFLPREAVERRVKMILADVEKIDKTKLEDPNRSAVKGCAHWRQRTRLRLMRAAVSVPYPAATRAAGAAEKDTTLSLRALGATFARAFW